MGGPLAPASALREVVVNPDLTMFVGEAYVRGGFQSKEAPDDRETDGDRTTVGSREPVGRPESMIDKRFGSSCREA